MADLSVTADLAELVAYADTIEAAADKVAAGAEIVARKYGSDVEAEAYRRSPVRTGNLRASITATTSGTRTGIQTVVGPTAHYGGYVELGTRRQRPQPYLGPAHDLVVEQAIEALAAIGEGAL